MSIKAIVFDLDRTLLRTDKTISPYTVDVLKECKKHGLRIMVATARPWRTAGEYCEMIGADAVVVSNGARVICGECRTEYGIRLESAVRLLNALARDPSLPVTLETGDTAYSNLPIAEYETVLTHDLVGVAKTEGALKILATYQRGEDLALIRGSLPDDLYYTVANGHLIQVMDKRATKWNGIKAMLDFCSCGPDETAYFGDDQDDIDPIKLCGLGVAVSNAIDEVKTVADYVADSNDEDGVAKYIEEKLLALLKL